MDDVRTADDGPDEGRSLSRRDLVRAGIVAAGVTMWSAPAITSVRAAPPMAGSPAPKPPGGGGPGGGPPWGTPGPPPGKGPGKGGGRGRR